MFLSRACDLSAKNGKVYISFAPEPTRPTIKREYNQLLSFCSKSGLLLDEKKEKFILYETPLFEYNTYKHLGGFDGTPWRYGDLLKLKGRNPNSKIKGKKILEKYIWKEVMIGKQRILVKQKTERNFPFRIYSLYKDGSYILKSVSRRDPVRPKIDIWTSNNVVLGSDNTEVVFFLIKSMAKKLPLNKIIKEVKSRFYLDKNIEQNIEKAHRSLKKVILKR